MKKSILLLLIGIIAKISLSNPIVVPPILTEIYLDGDNITIELYIQDFMWEWFGVYTLDDFVLTSNSSTVQFQDGINIIFNQEMVLDNSNLSGPFTFDPEGDIIGIEGSYVAEQFRFGNVNFASVVAPEPGQSLALDGYYDPESGYYYGWDIGIEETPTLGNNAFTVNTHGAMEGWIYDFNHDPIEGLKVLNHYTDENGYFYVGDLLCQIMNHLKIIHNQNVILNFQDTIYPNQTSQWTFYLDTVFTGIPEYYNHPNPIYGNTFFTINIPPQNQFASGYLAIYDMTGKQVDRIDIDRRQEEITWSSAGIDPGIYIYNLVLDGKKFGSRKMIVQ